MSTTGTIATVIVGMLASTAVLVWMLWRVCRSAERAERDPKYLRRRLFWLGMIYVLGAVFGIEQVVTRQQPVQSLFGLPVALFLAWFWLKTASKVKVPPASGN
jgi:threonine/homoserine/homoserine lactone efflux protein